MSRKYIRKPGTRRYVNYTPEQLEKCLQSIINGTYTVIKASEVFSIPKKTLYNKVNELKLANSKTVKTTLPTPKKYGGQTVFSKEEEDEFAQNLMAILEFGFPLTRDELRSIVRDYLQKKGKFIPKFRNNVPGMDWCNGFLSRNPALSARMATSRKRSDILNDPNSVLNSLSKKNQRNKPKRRKRLSKPVINTDNNADNDKYNEIPTVVSK